MLGTALEFITTSNQLTPTLAAPISLASLSFSGTATGYNVTGSTLTVSSNTSNSAGANTVTSNIVGGGTVTVSGGTLTLRGANTLGLATVAGGTLAINTSITAAGAVTIGSGGIFEINGVMHDAAIALNPGGTLRGVGAARENGVITVANGGVNFATVAGTDVLTLGNGDNDIIGGGSTNIISVIGPGKVVLAGDATPSNSLSAASKWSVDTGTLSIGSDLVLGTAPAAAVPDYLTLKTGGTLESTAAMTLNTFRGITLGAGGGRISTLAGLTYGGLFTGVNAFTKLGAQRPDPECSFCRQSVQFCDDCRGSPLLSIFNRRRDDQSHVGNRSHHGPKHWHSDL